MGTEIWCLLVVNFTLVGLMVYQQIFFTRQIQQLVDKLMSRTFTEYQQAITPPVKRARVEHKEAPDDLGSLHELQIGF
jgi:hypothetical protein